jgi:Tfp pilus assembly protein PilF
MTSVVAALFLLQASLERAQSLLREGKTTEAQQAVNAALTEHPDSVPALTLQGRLAMARNNFDLAQKSFTRAAELAPQSASVQFLLGFFHYVDNDFTKARPVLERARNLARATIAPRCFLL